MLLPAGFLAFLLTLSATSANPLSVPSSQIPVRNASNSGYQKLKGQATFGLLFHFGIESKRRTVRVQYVGYLRPIWLLSFNFCFLPKGLNGVNNKFNITFVPTKGDFHVCSVKVRR